MLLSQSLLLMAAPEAKQAGVKLDRVPQHTTAELLRVYSAGKGRRRL